MPGELDAVAVLLPGGSQLPTAVTGAIVSTQPLALVAPRSEGGSGRRPRSALAGRRWILNPRRCLIREALRQTLESHGLELVAAAEVHDLALQLSMVAAGLGSGLLPKRFVAATPRRVEVSRLQVEGVDLSTSVATIRAASLGPLALAARVLEEELRAHFGKPGLGRGRHDVHSPGPNGSPL